MIGLQSKSEQISALLEFVCADLQLTDTQYERATTAYNSISDWLSAVDSPVAVFRPDVYPQGSMATGTTNRPREGEEFDVDLVCSLVALEGTRPSRQKILSLIASRLRPHGTYGPMIEVRDRCVRVNYAGEFHADIVPGIPNPLDCDWGETAIVIPCRQEEKWVDTNPRGHKNWFFSRCESPLLMEKRAAVEPFPKPLKSGDKASLQREVQLFKRRRDVEFEDDDTFAPKSILLTTLCGLHVGPERLLYDATVGTLDRLLQAYTVDAWVLPPKVPNPSLPSENLARHWRENRKNYEAFLHYTKTFRSKMGALYAAEGMPEIARLLKELFDPSDRGIVKRAVHEYTESFQRTRNDGGLGLVPKKTTLTSTATAAAAAIPGNTFFGAKH